MYLIGHIANRRQILNFTMVRAQRLRRYGNTLPVLNAVGPGAAAQSSFAKPYEVPETRDLLVGSLRNLRAATQDSPVKAALPQRRTAPRSYAEDCAGHNNSRLLDD